MSGRAPITLQGCILMPTRLLTDRWLSPVPFFSVILGLGFQLVMWVVALPCSGQEWYPGEPPELGQMTSETESPFPADERDRQILGIAEKVTCKINSATWADLDCDALDNPGWDEVGNRQWSVSGTGEVNPTVAGTYDECTLTTYAIPTQAVTVTVTVWDSGNMGVDGPISRSRSFQVIPPSALSAEFLANEDAIGDTEGTPKQYIGACAYFKMTMGPNSVSFHSAMMQERLQAREWTWPDQTQESLPGKTLSIPALMWDNTAVDRVGLYGVSKEVLNNGNEYQDYTCSGRVFLDYFHDDLGWTEWYDGVYHNTVFQGQDLKAYIRYEADNVESSTPPMGPRKEWYEFP
jgi:hypothetical protein